MVKMIRAFPWATSQNLWRRQRIEFLSGTSWRRMKDTASRSKAIEITERTQRYSLSKSFCSSERKFQPKPQLYRGDQLTRRTCNEETKESPDRYLPCRCSDV